MEEVSLNLNVIEEELLKSYLLDNSLTLPASFAPYPTKFWEFLMISKYIYHNLDEIKANFIKSNDLSIITPHLEKCEEYFEHFKTTGKIYYQDYKSYFYFVLSEYNLKYRLKMSLEELAQFEKLYSNHILPNSTPCEYVDQSKWQTGNEEADKQTFIGHGFYWREGDCVVKDINGTGDYDCLEDNFRRVKGAKVAICDYELLVHDFPYLKDKSHKEIDEWLLNQVAYLSEGEIMRITGGDLNDAIEQNTEEYFSNEKKCAIRYRGGGRAVNFPVDNKFVFSQGVCQGELINVKGVGTEKIVESITKKLNGVLSLVDALKEYGYQKLIYHMAIKENTEITTVQTYAVIDLNINYRKDTLNPGTSYPGDKLALTVRQCTSRFVAEHDEIAYYSVVTCRYQRLPSVIEFIKTLRKYGITSEQLPLGYFSSTESTDDEDLIKGEWNLQSDGTLKRFVDFSQFIVMPNSPLPEFWRMTEKSFMEGMKCCRDGFEHLKKNPELLKLYYNTDDIEQVNAKHEEELKVLKEKYGDYAGRMNKSNYSWSWFLETDDSPIFLYALKTGTEGIDYTFSDDIADIMHHNFVDKIIL